MFGEYVFGNSPASYANLIWINDVDYLNRITSYSDVFEQHGFDVIEYRDDLSLRIGYEQKIKAGNEKLVVLNFNKAYIPYDIMKQFALYTVSLRTLFSKLNADVLHHKSRIDLDLLAMVAANSFDDLTKPEQTNQFFDTVVYGRDNLLLYFRLKLEGILQKATSAFHYHEWCRIAEQKAIIDRYSVQYGLNIDTSEINRLFQNYALKAFGTLSTKIDRDTPVLVSHAMEYIHEQSEKFAIIVMDGMSEFDWTILKRSFAGICYRQSAAFAMIPSTTSISRQCLLSGKYPSQLIEPWKQSKEKNEFYECARKYGYKDNQIGYERGYDASFSAFVKCGAVIILDIDELVHAQYQGRIGMLNDDTVLMKQNKLAELTKRLLQDGFDVYITADHGNTPCTGLGRLTGSGVEVETRSHKMVVLKDFANKDSLIERYGLLEYPKYYLPKDYDYLICNVGDSLDIKGENVMTHGGISLDEVVVPFIIARTEDYHG